MVKLADFESKEYKQGAELDKFNKLYGDAIAQRSDVNGGICLSLCMNWIFLHRDHKQGKSGEYKLNSMSKRMKGLMSDSEHFGRAMNSQAWDYTLAAQSSTSIADHFNSIGEKYRIHFPDPPIIYHGLSQHILAFDKTHAYTVSGFYFTKAGKRSGHAICSYKSGGNFLFGSHLYVFDPNLGEFRVPTKHIREFYIALFDKYGGFLNVQNSGKKMVTMTAKLRP